MTQNGFGDAISGLLIGGVTGGMIMLALAGKYDEKHATARSLIVEGSKAYTLNSLNQKMETFYSTTNGVYVPFEEIEKQVRAKATSDIELRIKQELKAIK